MGDDVLVRVGGLARGEDAEPGFVQYRVLTYPEIPSL